MSESPFTFGHHRFVPLADHALLWPDRAALLVADIHFEKASWLAQGGQLLPPYDTRDALDRLARLIGRHRVQEVWCLGDSLQDAAAPERMDAESLFQLRRLTGAVEWTWIVGNHDPVPDIDLGGRWLREAVVDGLVLRHAAAPQERRPEISGHYHPKLWLRVRGRRIARRCFALGPRKLILPSFGAFTGGLDVTDPAVCGLLGDAPMALVATATALRRYPIGALPA